MSRPQRIIPLLLAIAAFASGCSGNKKTVERAKKSLYDADFAVIYSAALEATREIYPNLDDNPGAGAVKTAWHQVTYANNSDDLSQGRSLSTGAGGNQLANSQGQAQAGMPTRLAYKRFFIRFDISVVGGRPWRVKINGHASEWEPGAALPVELRGPAKPHWLDGRSDALTLAIYKRIKRFAVPMKEAPVEIKIEDTLPKTDPKAFTNLPPDAAKRLAQLRDAVSLREYGNLRAQVFDDVAWSLGGAPGAETAMAMWQADPEALDAMAKVISTGVAGGPGGCAPVGDKKVSCPGVAPAPGAYQLVIELRGTEWKVSSFVRAE
ncbi:MAG: hypothetical protein H0V17_21510 [Deltaproteobacteria bacterium]|nr:hypothetical protein [Deltaproteobacteria bacterium]